MPALLLLTLALAADPPEALALRPLGRLTHPAIREASGVVASRRFPGIFWVHNDSGNPPALFAVKRDGSLVREYAVSVPNVDWEDVAVDDKGHLFLGEIGNNDGRLPLRAVYQLDEPNPLVEEQAEPPRLKVTTASYYRFGPGGRFDAEALVIDGDRALIIAKTFDGRDAEVYAVPLAPPAPLLRPATAEKVAVLRGFNRPVTGADLTPGGRLVVTSYAAIGVYERDRTGGWKAVSLKMFRGGDGVEGVAWDGADLLLVGEGRGVHRLTEADWRGSRSSPRRTVRNGR